MRNIKAKNPIVKNNLTPNRQQSENLKNELNLNEFPIVLKRALLDYESEMRKTLKYYDVYEDVSLMINCTPRTLRKYTENVFPTLDKLVSICMIINDFTPLEFVNDYLRARGRK